VANSSDSVSSWPGLLAQLNKTFLLIRDVFGYALPGGVFLAIGVISKRFSLLDVQNLLHPYQPPAWAVFILLVGACYAVGDILASTAYMPIAIRKWIQWQFQKQYLYPLKDRPVDFDKPMKDNATKVDWLKDNPTEVTADLLEIKTREPEFFVELDRRETLMLLSGSTAVALLGGWFFFYIYKVHPRTLFAIAGIVVVIQFSTGISHLRRVRSAIREADRIPHPATPNSRPDFQQLLADLIKAATNALGKL